MQGEASGALGPGVLGMAELSISGSERGAHQRRFLPGGVAAVRGHDLPGRGARASDVRPIAFIFV